MKVVILETPESESENFLYQSSISGGTEEGILGWKSCSGLLEEFRASQVSICWNRSWRSKKRILYQNSFFPPGTSQATGNPISPLSSPSWWTVLASETMRTIIKYCLWKKKGKSATRFRIYYSHCHFQRSHVMIGSIVISMRFRSFGIHLLKNPL